MAEHTSASPSSPDGGTVARALRATAAGVTIAQTWRDYIEHTAACSDCRHAGVNCADAADLKQAWLDARLR